MMPDYVVMGTYLFLSLLSDVIHGEQINWRPIIQTDKGKVQGITEFPFGKKVDIFYSIPFARPPVGDLRFKPPVQLDPWDGVLDASSKPNSCIQIFDHFFGNFTGSTMWNANTRISEDCLYLNVWTPRTNPPFEKKSVIVFIYGGGFYSGTSTLDIYQGNILAVENDVVVVSMQYRVGAFGFLAMDSSDAPGNAGLWDQRMALEWVSRNIQQFGGDPLSVTLVGESAGAVSVGLHLLCDVCRGYFHRAILQSGAPEVKWSGLPKEEMWSRSRRLAHSVGCYKEGSPNYMLECMKQRNATEIMDKEFFSATGILQFPFVPIVDGVFLRQDPQELVNGGVFKKIPLLLGSNNNEITFFLVYTSIYFNKSSAVSPLSRKMYGSLMNKTFLYYPHFPHELNEFGIEAIKHQYTNYLNSEDGIAFRNSLDEAGSDFFFVCAVNSLARAYSKFDQPVYYYWFNQRWSAQPWPEWMGVLHADEFWFTFGHALNESHSFTRQERELSRTMMRYWTNFAKTGDPNKAPGEAPLDEWPQFHYNEQMYLNISTKTMASGRTWGQGPRTQQCAFWDVYLPKLVAETSDISEAEREWKQAFHTWKTRYIVDWKNQFDSFMQNYKRRTPSSCGGDAGRP